VFKQSLRKIVDNVDGGAGAVIMGFDGIAVETYAPQEGAADVTTLGMEFSFILTQIKKAGESLELGGMEEIAIRAEKLTVVTRMITSDYFLAVALGPDGNFGKARYLMRVEAGKLKAEL
jgi:predicted regulator of Ras-like GTPase activity (Roadblock/LC7/MglB family)